MSAKYQIQGWRKTSINNNIRQYLKGAKGNNSREQVGTYGKYLLYQLLCINAGDTMEIKTQALASRSSRSTEGEWVKGEGSQSTQIFAKTTLAGVVGDIHRIFWKPGGQTLKGKGGSNRLPRVQPKECRERQKRWKGISVTKRHLAESSGLKPFDFDPH